MWLLRPCKGKSRCLLSTSNIRIFKLIPGRVRSLAELRSGSGDVPFSRHGCIYQDIAAVCLSSIWTLVGFMICSTGCSRYSTTIARMSGSNTISVLATLFLLSYAELLQTIIASISFTVLTDRHGNTPAVWLLDGNILAMKGSHMPLVIMSIVALVVYVLPFTLLVLLSPWLQAKSSHHLLHWVTRIKPLLDAYQGPYRN